MTVDEIKAVFAGIAFWEPDGPPFSIVVWDGGKQTVWDFDTEEDARRAFRFVGKFAVGTIVLTRQTAISKRKPEASFSQKQVYDTTPRFWTLLDCIAAGERFKQSPS